MTNWTLSPASATSWRASCRNATACRATRHTASFPTGKIASIEPATSMMRIQSHACRGPTLAVVTVAALVALCGLSMQATAQTVEAQSSARALDQDVPGLPPTPVSRDQYQLATTRIADDYKS